MPNVSVKTRSGRRRILSRAATTITDRNENGDLDGTAKTIAGQTQQLTYDQQSHQILSEILNEQRLIRMHMELITGQQINISDIETR